MSSGWRIGTLGAGATAALLASGASARAQDTTVPAGTASGSVVTVEGPTSPTIVVGSTTAAVTPAQDVAAQSDATPIRTDAPPPSQASTTADSTAAPDTSQVTDPTVSAGDVTVTQATSTSASTTP